MIVERVYSLIVTPVLKHLDSEALPLPDSTEVEETSPLGAVIRMSYSEDKDRIFTRVMSPAELEREHLRSWVQHQITQHAISIKAKIDARTLGANERIALAYIGQAGRWTAADSSNPFLSADEVRYASDYSELLRRGIVTMDDDGIWKVFISEYGHFVYRAMRDEK